MAKKCMIHDTIYTVYYLYSILSITIPIQLSPILCIYNSLLNNICQAFFNFFKKYWQILTELK